MDQKNLASNLTPDERLALVAREESRVVPLLWQAELLSVSRSRLYYEAQPAREQEVRIKHRLDEWYTKRPCLGTRKLVHLLAEDGLAVGRHTIRRYREEMGLSTLHPKPSLSRPSRTEHRVYPYLLRDLPVERPNQVWGVDITYIGLRSGFLYLVAFLDWFSRLVVAWELSDTLELSFVLSCADAGLGRAVPEIINSDQGSHFTSERFTGRVLSAGARVSMDGRGRYVDNIFTERLWRSVTPIKPQVRGGVPRRLRNAQASTLRACVVPFVLQPEAPASSLELLDARCRSRRTRQIGGMNNNRG